MDAEGVTLNDPPVIFHHAAAPRCCKPPFSAGLQITDVNDLVFVLPLDISVTLAPRLLVIKTFEPLVLYSVRVFFLPCSISERGGGVHHAPPPPPSLMLRLTLSQSFFSHSAASPEFEKNPDCKRRTGRERRTPSCVFDEGGEVEK